MLGVLAGGGLTLFSGWLTDKRLNDRERERRNVDRQDRIALRQSDFQRETLLALQTASQKLIRNTAASLHQDIVAHRTGGEWQQQQLPDNLSDEGLQWRTEMLLLASRIRDEETRTLADGLRDQLGRVAFSTTEQGAEFQLGEAAKTHARLIDRAGSLVRDIDRICTAAPDAT